MTSSEPGDRRRLAQPPSARYAPAPPSESSLTGRRSALIGPLLRADIAAAVGAGALVVVGAVVASTFGLLFVAGVMGAAIGLLLARAVVPADGAAPVARGLVTRLAIGIALVSVVVGYVGIWLYARGEGGTLELLDYLWTTFGPFVPGVAIVAAVAAGWGASAGPVQR